MKKKWDIFCKVVDNFGDIGVCWRLAKQLAHEHGLQVRLLVDDLQVASKIIPTIDFNKTSQLIDNVEIINFNFDAKPAEVVIEAFACGLPTAYQNAMVESTVWVNLEYLSAENWVADFHAGSSQQGDLRRHFYFPGFTESTGGLLRECGLIEKNNRFVSALPEAEDFKISLFCYENAPLQALFDALLRSQQTITVFAPFAPHFNQIAPLFKQVTVSVGDVLTKGNLTLQVLPFLSQTEYDKLLWSCDLNFVRGEDSWVRAIWAGKPFIWQPYVQTEDAHLTKLNAFLDIFYPDIAAKRIVESSHLAWATGQFPSAIWQAYVSQYAQVLTATLEQSQQLANQPDLAFKLVTFCNNA